MTEFVAIPEQNHDDGLADKTDVRAKFAVEDQVTADRFKIRGFRLWDLSVFFMFEQIQPLCSVAYCCHLDL